jgi:hypothetical protein
MAIRKIRTGTKSTQRDQLVLAGSFEDQRDTIRYAESQSTFESWASKVEPAVKEILASSPPLTGNDFEHQTPASYAQLILRRIRLVRAAIRAADAEQAAHHAVRLGLLVCEADMKEDADKRYDRRLFSAQGGRRNKDRHSPRNRLMADEYLALKKQKPNLSDSHIKELVGKRQKTKIGRSQSILIIDAELRRRKNLSGRRS